MNTIINPRRSGHKDTVQGFLAGVFFAVATLALAYAVGGCTVHVTPDVNVNNPKINLTACIEEVEGEITLVVCPDASAPVDAGEGAP